ncbi:hypothetical protein QQG91_06355 [Marivivens sp. LCG002]|uniref:hypothetical protein n=1 Tax=Marivivens sp. LCG002 TaxID=3051171 RepID=UPI002552732D|nr:hypothetical protein [Marivivens sp. LCG002]WIV52058.1 hypothetical protein QQG91_06355 [Marivivens sp. LCG002]
MKTGQFTGGVEPSMTAATAQRYRNTWRQFEARFRREKGLGNDALIDQRDFGEFLLSIKLIVKPQTWRNYEAAILFVILENPDYQDVLQSIIFGKQADKVIAGTQLDTRLKRTSARKARYVTPEDFEKLHKDIGRSLKNLNRERLYHLMTATLHTGLRPCEWPSARLLRSPENAALFLKVSNAKATNDRANGTSRTINLTRLPNKVIEAIAFTVGWASPLKDHDPDLAAGYPKTLKRIRAMLARSCQRVFPKRKSLICLYTLRHQFIANMKQTLHERAEAGFDVDLRTIAALAGHCSTATAERHYARRSGAWPKNFRNSYVRAITTEVETVRLVEKPAPWISNHKSQDIRSN